MEFVSSLARLIYDQVSMRTLFMHLCRRSIAVFSENNARESAWNMV